MTRALWCGERQRALKPLTRSWTMLSSARMAAKSSGSTCGPLSPGVLRRVDSNLAVNGYSLNMLLLHAKEQAAEAATAVIAGALIRCPADNVHQELGIVDIRHHKLPPISKPSQQWQQQQQQQQQQRSQHHETFMQATAALAERSGASMSPVLSSLPQLPAPLFGTELCEEADDAYCILTTAAASTSKVHIRALDQHCQQCGPPHQAQQWVILSDIASVQVPGSVEEERLFSKLACIKNNRRNRLGEQLLNACLSLATQRMWELEQFPFQRAMAKWSAAKKRWRPVPLGNQQQQQPITIFDTDDDGNLV
eukprot:1146073-Pelagomonas_calceolata.AAC.1